MINRILVIPPMAIGDSVVFNPLLKTLKKNFKQSELTLLTIEFLRPLTTWFYGYDRLLVVPDDFANPKNKNLSFDPSSIMSGNYDLAIDTYCFNSCHQLLKRINVAQAIGMEFDLLMPTPYTSTLDSNVWNENRSIIDLYLDFARHLGIRTLDYSTDINLSRIPKTLDNQNLRSVQNRLRNRKAIAILLAGGDWHKRYPPELVTKLLKTCPIHNVSLVIFFGPDEYEYYEPFFDEWKNIKSIHVEIVVASLKSCISLLASCHGAIGNDCGLMHICVSLGMPVLGLFGPTQSKAWFPYYDRKMNRFLESKVFCRPCYGQDREKCGDNICMREFSPSLVWREFLELNFSVS